jgi:vacuolar-type H+-ATPase subunit D/Vma8
MPDDSDTTLPKKTATATTITDTTVSPQSDQAATDSKQESPKLDQTKPFYKKPKFWMIVGTVTVGVTVITLGLIYRQNVIKNQQTISDGWHAVVGESNTTIVLGEQIKTPDQYTDYSRQLHKFAQLLNDKKYASEKMPTFLSNGKAVDEYRGFLDRFNSYIANAASQGDTVSDLTTSDITQLDQQANSAREGANTLKTDNTYLSETMPDKIYLISATLDKVKNEIDTRKSEEKAAKDAAEAQKVKDAADVQTVQTNVSQYLTAFVAGNGSTMRRYMTQAYQNEFDFNQLTPESRATVYPASFRVIVVKKQEDGNYKATANVLYKYHDNPSQYTNGYEYVLIPTTNAVGWLINTEKIGASY